MASNGCITPSWPPSSSITLTSRARIRSLIRIRSACRKFLSAITPPHRHKNNNLDLFGNMPSANFRGRHDPPHHVHREESTGDGLQSIARCLLISASVTSAAFGGTDFSLCSFDFCRFYRARSNFRQDRHLWLPSSEGALRFSTGPTHHLSRLIPSARFRRALSKQVLTF
jgi:hypothetical protein